MFLFNTIFFALVELRETIKKWIIALQDKLKNNAQLDDRKFALQKLEETVQRRRLEPPFDDLPQRGQLNVREFIKQLKEMPDDQAQLTKQMPPKSKSSLEIKGPETSTSEMSLGAPKKLSRPSSQTNLAKKFEDQKAAKDRKTKIKSLEDRIKTICEPLHSMFSVSNFR